jgi:hypothetical protein
MVITVPWENQSNIWWNDICAKIIEHFGLPGDRYTSHPTENNMKFIFHDDRDGLMCKLLVSEYI